MTSIEWTDLTWNPLRARNKETGQVGWHCEVVSAGCCKPGEITCYANQKNKGFFNLGTSLPYTRESRDKVKIYLDEKTLVQPLHWKKPRKVFVCSMTDLFGEFHTDEMIDRVFAVMALCPQHVFQVLTKRPERMRQYVERLSHSINPLEQVARELGRAFFYQGLSLLPWPIRNIWMGCSVEDQKTADERIPYLLQTPATVRFLSCEPLLSEINLRRYLPISQYGLKGDNFDKISFHGGRFGNVPAVSWVICGGESGPGARPCHPAWVRSIRDQCKAAGTKFFMKQWGEWLPGSQAKHLSDGQLSILKGQPVDYDGVSAWCFRAGKKSAGRLLDGVEHSEFPL